MPNLHDIEKRIKSVSSTKQITRTMEMVAGAKVKHASDRVLATAPYACAMSELFQSTAAGVDAGECAALQQRSELKAQLVVAIVSDRGLAGGFNSNVLRAVEARIRENKQRGIHTHVIACGKKALGFFKFRGVTPVMEFKDLSAEPTIEQAQEIASYAVNAFDAGDIDELVLVYNHMKNAAEQVLCSQTVLPAEKPEQAHMADGEQNLSASFEFEPEPVEVLTTLIPDYVRTCVHHALIDSAAGEQCARRSAMHSATENANEMVETLSRLYNRVRQGAITTEISEIVGGAAALEE